MLVSHRVGIENQTWVTGKDDKLLTTEPSFKSFMRFVWLVGLFEMRCQVPLAGLEIILCRSGWF